MTALITSRLKDRTVFMNGGARGIGRASALRLASEGAKVWITSRDEAAMAEALSEATSLGLVIHGLLMDSAEICGVVPLPGEP